MINKNNKKQNREKTSLELAEEIKEQERNEKTLDLLVEEEKKIIDLKLSELKVTKHKIVIEVGEFLEENHIVATDKICGTIKRKFRGYINQGTIWDACSKHKDYWLNESWKGHEGTNQHIKARRLKTNEQGLTEQEQQYVTAYENETKRNREIKDLIYSLTNLTKEQQDKIMMKTPKGDNWRNNLVSETYNHRLTLAKQMITHDLGRTIYYLRTLKTVIDDFTDILLEEQETRKNKEHLEST